VDILNALRRAKSGVALRFPPQSMAQIGLSGIHLSIPLSYREARKMIFPPERKRR
jgi:hypothetical protein